MPARFTFVVRSKRVVIESVSTGVSASMHHADAPSFWMANEADDLMAARGIILGLALSSLLWACIVTLTLQYQ
jgi:hypothetical protein